ncbi:MAG: acyl-CoA dehydrogenase [Janthinobacterium lividum]
MDQSEAHDIARDPLAARDRSAELNALIEAIGAAALERDRERIAPFEAMALFKAGRWGALRLPVQAGGDGASLRQLFNLVIRLGEADSNVAQSLRNHFAFVERYVRLENDERARRWRRWVADGALFGLGSTELSSTKAGRGESLETTVTPRGEGYVLNGTKYYSTGNLYVDYIQVRAQSGPGTKASVIVPVTREGVELLDDWDGMGQRLTGSGTSNFKDVAVSADEVVFDEPGKGYERAYASTFPQLYLTAINAGILRAILRDANSMLGARQRSFYHAPTPRPADDVLLLQTIGQISANAFVAESAVLAAGELLDAAYIAYEQGRPADELALQAALAAAKTKIIVDDLAIKSGALLFDVGGASAAKKSQNLDAHWRNARTLASHNPAAYKAAAIGNYEVNGVPLPNGSYF